MEIAAGAHVADAMRTLERFVHKATEEALSLSAVPEPGLSYLTMSDLPKCQTYCGSLEQLRKKTVTLLEHSLQGISYDDMLSRVLA